MRLTGPLYEGDSLLRSGPAFGSDAAEDTGAVVPPVDPKREGPRAEQRGEWEIESQAHGLRATYAGELLRRAWARLEAWLEEARRSRDEAYLARSQNLADLESRLRKLERDGYVPHL
jgi:hypothetical protein